MSVVSWTRRAVALALAGVSVCAGQSLAQSVSRPAGVRVTQKDWVFVPVVVQDVGSLAVPGVLALRDKSQAVGENLVAVWYENPGVQGVEWPAKSWESQDQWEAIKWVKEQFGIGDDYDVFWPTSDPKTEGWSSEVPQNYFKGLLTSDPFAELVDEPDGETIVALLTMMGYKAASVDVDKDGPCDTKTILPALVDTTAFAVLAQPPLNQVEARFESLVPATCAQVVPPPPPPPPVVPGTTTPQPGTPLNPGGPWQTDHRPPWYDPFCSTATSCCYRQKIIWLYTTTNWLGLTVIRYCESDISWSCPNPTGAPCPAAPTCAAPPGPYFPPPPPGPVPCGFNYY
jgi:hypothetical protein